MGTSDYKNFLQSIFFRGQGAQSFDVVVSVGGVDNTSASITYDVNHYSGGALVVTQAGGSIPVSLSGTQSTRIFDSSGNSIIATNTAPTWTEQALIVRPILPTGSVASLTSITGTANSIIIAATDGTRKGVLIVNDTIQAFFLKYGLTASTTSYSVRMPSLSYWEMPVPVWQGRMDGIWDASNTGAARVTILS